MAEFTRREEVRDVYRRRAAHYDLTANLYYLIGFREWAYRRRAVDAMELRSGDVVVELGCGTGLNFQLLQERIGPEGRIIGVDLTPEMLAQARRRADTEGWKNVELIESSAADYRFPERVDGVISTFALTLEPRYAEVIQRAARALQPDRRFVLADLRLPDNWLRRLAPLLMFLVRPFAVSMKVAERRPWEVMRKELTDYRYEPGYFGFVYVASGMPHSKAEAVRD
mgnify:CR=1 FL=1